MTIADQRRINDLERTIEALRQSEATALQDLESCQQANQRLVDEIASVRTEHARVVQERFDAINDLDAAQRRINELERAAFVYRPERQYRSVRPVLAHISERILMHEDERIVSTTPGVGNNVIVWVESLRPEPEAPEADRTPEGEREVTEEEPGA